MPFRNGNNHSQSDSTFNLTPEQIQQIQNLEVAEDTEISGQRTFASKPMTRFITIWASLTAILHIYFLVYRPIDPLLLRSLHVMTLSVLGFLLVPMSPKFKDRVHIFDWIGALLAVVVFAYMYINFQELIWRIRVRPTNTDVVIAVIGIILVLELTRRCSGNALLILAMVFLGYGLFGNYLPGLLRHAGYDFNNLMGYVYSDYGIFNAPIAISTRYIILFIIFAAFLQTSGVGNYFVKWAFSISGHARGGPAKVAVIASALMGTMNGTSAGNAVATGSLTIPLMKKVGYSPTFAAATEAVASTGGQIMPPIMGAGIFIMAEITKIPYQRIMLAGIIPAILYFTSTFLMVDYEAVKLNLKGFPREALPKFGKVMQQSYLFVPVVVLFAYILSGRSVIMAGWMGIVTSFMISWAHALINRDIKLGMDVPKVIKAMENGSRGSIQLMAVCAAAGILMGIVSKTGVAIKFANLILGIAGTSQLLALLFTMGLCILLGMGMPTTAAYAVAASVLTPGLIRMGLPVLVAHMFVFYFACISAITPPVALASYAASGISGSDPMKTGYMSFRLGVTAYIVPFMFFYAPSLILGDMPTAMFIGETPITVFTVLLRSATALLGVWALASAAQRWYFGSIKTLPQIMLFAAAICLMTASTYTDLVGASILVVLFIYQRFLHKNQPLKGEALESGS